MKTEMRQWVFVDRNHGERRIVVHDEKSAGLVRELILQGGALWVEVAESHLEVSPQVPEVEKSRVASPPELPKPAVAQAGSPPPLKKSGAERRIHKRHDAEFRVVVISGAHSFRNSTSNVSLGGIKLKKSLPSVFLKQRCTIFISHPSLSENVQINCKVISDEKDLLRIQFVDADPRQITRLEQWLAGNGFGRSVA